MSAPGAPVPPSAPLPTPWCRTAHPPAPCAAPRRWWIRAGRACAPSSAAHCLVPDAPIVDPARSRPDRRSRARTAKSLMTRQLPGQWPVNMAPERHPRDRQEQTRPARPHTLFANPGRAVIRRASLDGGCIAQLVEQLTLNQRVVGSNPTAPTLSRNASCRPQVTGLAAARDPGHSVVRRPCRSCTPRHSPQSVGNLQVMLRSISLEP